MRWLVLSLVAGALSVSPFVACSNSSSPSLGTMDASQPGPTKFEAGTNCASSNDCETGLVCLYPVGAGYTCQSFQVCTTAPPSPCDHPTAACSCLGEPVQVCDGFAVDPVDPTGTCDGGTVIVPLDGGEDAPAPASEAGPDAPSGADASDGASE
jgi:hypothetical protein